MKPLGSYETVLFLLQLRQLLTDKMSAAQALAVIAEASPDNGLKVFLRKAVIQLHNGASLKDALFAEGYPFPSHLEALFQGQETSGHAMVQLLDAGIGFLKVSPGRGRKADTLCKCSIISIPFVVFLLAMLFIVPMFSGFSGETVGFPQQTRLIFAMSDFVQSWILCIVPGMLALVFVLLKLEQRRVHSSDLAVAFKLISQRVGEGHSIEQSLDLAVNTTASDPLRKIFDLVKVRVANGAQLSEAFSGVRGIPPLVCRLVRMGEDIGDPAKQLAEAGVYFRHLAVVRRNREGVLVTVSLFVTLIVLLMMLFSCFLPLFTLAGAQ